jgi:PIN domain nuclease of toxin-antitoxin system
VKLLLDTHILIWAVSAPDRLLVPAREAIQAPGNDVYVSAISLWEIAIKSALGRLQFPLDRIDPLLHEMGLEPLPLTVAHAVVAGGLPRHHDDPFDRALVAQARLEGMTLVTADSWIEKYDVSVFGRPPW